MADYDLKDRDDLRIDLSFYLTLGAMALFIGIGRLVMNLPFMMKLPSWLWLLLASYPLQIAYILCAVYPARKHCHGRALFSTLDIKQASAKWFCCALFGTLLLILMLSILTGGWCFVLQYLHISAPEQPLMKLLRYGPLNLLSVIIPCAVLLAPIGEELCFRHIIFKKMEAYNGTKAGVIASSVFFAAFHLNLQSFPALVILALWLIWLYKRSGSLTVSMFAHAVFNTASIMVVLLSRIRYF